MVVKRYFPYPYKDEEYSGVHGALLRKIYTSPESPETHPKEVYINEQYRESIEPCVLHNQHDGSTISGYRIIMVNGTKFFCGDELDVWSFMYKDKGRD